LREGEHTAGPSTRATSLLRMTKIFVGLGCGTRMQVDAFLQQHEIFDYSVDDLEKDLATLDRVVAAKER
jgi:hypothetical protein